MAVDIKVSVEVEIGGDWERTNAHGVDLRRCLIEPYRVACRNTLPRLNEGKPLDLWVVLEEKPGRREGYLIVFDETRGWFGLAVWDADTPVFLGFHGSFLRTFETRVTRWTMVVPCRGRPDMNVAATEQRPRGA